MKKIIYNNTGIKYIEYEKEIMKSNKEGRSEG